MIAACTTTATALACRAAMVAIGNGEVSLLAGGEWPRCAPRAPGHASSVMGPARRRCADAYAGIAVCVVGEVGVPPGKYSFDRVGRAHVEAAHEKRTKTSVAA